MRKCLSRFITITIITSILSLGLVMQSRQVFAQQDASDFTQTFQVFMQSQDAFRLYDLSPDEVVYPLPPSYTIGPGDILQVILTGMISDALVVQVGPQGDIFVPPAGLLTVQGMTIGDTHEYIDTELAKYFINYQCSVQLLKARRIKVYLLGQVRQPGQYVALAGTSTVSLIQTAGTLVTNPQSYEFIETEVTHPYFRALTAGAGRMVEVWRDGERVGRVDLASVAIRGRTANDIILEDGDALYVAPNSHPVVVRGGVVRPGTYEIRQGDTVLDLIAQAGGYRSMMMLGSVDIERPNPASATGTDIISLALNDPNFVPGDFQFQPGDIIRVPEVRDQVYVMGAVWMPQAVDFHEGWTVIDYIAQTGGPVSPSDISSIRIIRFPLTDLGNMSEFDLKAILTGEEGVESVPIEPGDMIWVPWKNQPFYGPGVTNAIATILGQTVSFLRILKDLG